MACVRFARRPGSVCAARAGASLTLWKSCHSVDFILVVGRGRKRTIRGVAGREHTYGQRQLNQLIMPFPRLKVDLRSAQYGQKRRTRSLALFAPKQSVSIDHLQLNAPTGGRIEENAEERFDLSSSDRTWRFGDGTDRFSSTCSISSDGKS